MITDWKLKLMQVLEGVGKAEGTWFELWWEGISEEERTEIENAYDVYLAAKKEKH